MHLASFMPFDKAAEMIGVILSVQTNEETARQLSERMGACMEAAQIVEVETPCAQQSKEEPRLLRCVISSDGAMVPLTNKQWAEVRTLAIGEPQEKFNAKGEREIHVSKLSYYSRLADASSFIELAEVEIRRRKVREAKQVCAVTDGADWCQSLTDRHRPDAVRILDFPHAAEHVNLLLESLQKAKIHFPEHVLERCLHILKHRGPRPLLCLADRLLKTLPQQEGESCHLEYLRRREALMQYPRFRKLGWPIGSGMVESANKNVVEARLKGAGMHWERKNVNPMLALRTAVCNGRWQEMWQKAVLQYQRQQAQRRSDRVAQRAQASQACDNPSQMPSLLESAAASEAMSLAAQPASEQRSPTIASAPIAPAARPPSSSRSSTHRPRSGVTHYKRKANTQHFPRQTKVQASGDRCICGTLLVQSKGSGRTKHFCSNRCRVQAHRKREKKWIASVRQQVQSSREQTG